MSQTPSTTQYGGIDAGQTLPDAATQDSPSDLPVNVDEALLDHTRADESVYGTLVGPAGLERVDGDDTETVEDPVLLAVTDQRVLLLAVAESGIDAHSVSLSELGAVVVRQVPPVVELVTTESVRVRVLLPITAIGEDVDVLRHLRWLGDVRGRVAAIEADVSVTLSEIREDVADGRYELARTKYDCARRTVDSVVDAVQRVEPVADADLAPELTALDRSLEEAGARISIAEARNRLDLARELIHVGSFDLARQTLEEAREHWADADACAATIRATQALQFGCQRELLEDVEELDWELDTVAAEPLRIAEQLRASAQAATDTEQRIDDYETALRHYEEILDSKSYASDISFDGDAASVRSRIVEVGAALVDAYQERGSELLAGDGTADISKAPSPVTDARDCFERARELADEFAPEEVADIEQTMAVFLAGA